MRVLPPVLLLALAACTQFPELDGVVAPDVESAEFPALLPLETALAGTEAVVTDPVDTTAALETRVERLRARAQALQRRAIVDPATRARMQARLNDRPA